MDVVGLVLHPLRDSAEAVDAVLGWAKRKGAQVLGIETEIRRLNCAARLRSFSEVTKTRSARRNIASSLATMRRASGELEDRSSMQ